jgi:hypothetical protein
MNPTGILKTVLDADSAVNAIVSGRIYPDTAPQTAVVPFLILSIIYNDPNDTKSGVATEDKFRVQIDCYTAGAFSVAQLDAAVRTALDRYAGSVVVSGDATYTVDGIQYLDTNSALMEGKDLFRRSSDYQIRIKR